MIHPTVTYLGAHHAPAQPPVASPLFEVWLLAETLRASNAAILAARTRAHAYPHH